MTKPKTATELQQEYRKAIDEFIGKPVAEQIVALRAINEMFIFSAIASLTYQFEILNATLKEKFNE